VTARVTAARGGHHHLAWDDQPLVRSTPRHRRYARRFIALAFVAGLLVGLMF
jgi:hypothetical protein